MKIIAARLITTALLISFVYKDTQSVWLLVALVLITIPIEYLLWWIKQMQPTIKILVNLSSEDRLMIGKLITQLKDHINGHTL